MTRIPRMTEPGGRTLGGSLSGRAMHSETALLGRYAPDLTRDPGQVWLSKYHCGTYHPGRSAAGCDWARRSLRLGIASLEHSGWSFGGTFLRTTLGLHATWLVNSATHLWGARRFETKDDSRNNWWVAIVTGGEGWHNNHHAHPVSARHGLAWYEFDINYYGIWLLSKVGPCEEDSDCPVRIRRTPNPQELRSRTSKQCRSLSRRGRLLAASRSSPPVRRVRYSAESTPTRPS